MDIIKNVRIGSLWAASENYRYDDMKPYGFSQLSSQKAKAE